MGDAHVVQACLEFVYLGILHQEMFLVQLLDNVFVTVPAVNVDQHGFDRRVALDERAW